MPYHSLLITASVVAALSMPITPAYSALEATSTMRQSQDSAAIAQLDVLLREALDSNQSLSAKRLHAEASRETPARVSSLPDPVFGVGYQPYPVFTARGTQRFQLQLDQKIPFPGKLGLRKKIAEYSALIAAYDVGVAERILVYRVKVSYFELFRIQEQLALIEEFRAQLADLVTSTTARYKVGEGTQQDILKAQLERNQLDEISEGLTGLRLSESEALAKLLNRPSGATLSSKIYSVERAARPRGEEAGYSIAMRNRPEVLAQQTAIRQSESKVQLAKKMFWPDFSAGIRFYEIGGNNLTPTMTGQNALGIQLKVSLPLWRDKLKSGIKESRLLRAENNARLRDLETGISTQINAAEKQLESENRTLNIYERTLIPQSESTLQASLNAYASGRASFLDLLDAERTLFGLRMAYLDSRSRASQYAASLQWALGSMPAGYGDLPLKF